MIEKTKKKAVIIGSAVAAVALIAGGGLLFAGHADSEVRDDFSFPDHVVKNAVVGQRTEIARIMPAVGNAESYGFIVLDGEGNEIKTEGYTFFPEKAGEYKCVYYYVDDGEARNYSYKISAEAKDGPVFEKSPVFPTAFIAGKTYSLPVVSAAEWSGGTEVPADVSVKVEANGKELPVGGGKVTFSDSGFYDADITYTARTGNKTETYSEKVPVVDLKTVNAGGKTVYDTSKLFLTSGFDSSSVYFEPTSSGGERVAGLSFKTTGDASAEFVNVLSSDGVNFTFGFGTLYAAENLRVKIESIEDPSVFITLDYVKGKEREGKGKVILNGASEKELTYNGEDKLHVAFNAASNKFTDGEKQTLFEVATDFSGGEFKGFTGHKVKVSFSLTGVYGAAEMRIYDINNQTLGNEKDLIAPTAYIENLGTEHFVGDKVKIFDRFAVDVIDPDAKMSLSVYLNDEPVNDVNGEPIVNVGEEKEIWFNADKAGEYLVLYTIIDADGNGEGENKLIIIDVYDRTKPTLEVKGSVAEKAEGGRITLPAAKVSAGDKAVRIQLTVIYPSLKMRQINNPDSGEMETAEISERVFSGFTEKGVYIFRYVAVDEYFNCVAQEFKVIYEG